MSCIVIDQMLLSQCANCLDTQVILVWIIEKQLQEYVVT